MACSVFTWATGCCAFDIGCYSVGLDFLDTERRLGKLDGDPREDCFSARGCLESGHE